jgi:hypothetical protein
MYHFFRGVNERRIAGYTYMHALQSLETKVPAELRMPALGSVRIRVCRVGNSSDGRNKQIQLHFGGHNLYSASPIFLN